MSKVTKLAIGATAVGLDLAGRVSPCPPRWLYLLGFPPFVLAYRLPDTPLTSAPHELVGVALGWLAVSLWRAEAAWGAGTAAQGRTGPWATVGRPARGAH